MSWMKRAVVYALLFLLPVFSSVRFDAESEYLGRTANLVNYNSTYTTMFWVYLSADTDFYGHCWGITADNLEQTNNYQNSDFVGMDADGTTRRFGTYNAGSGSPPTGGSFTTATWYHITIRRNSTTSMEMLVNGSVVLTETQTVVGRSAVGGEWMGRLNGGYPMNGRVAYFKQWSAALSGSEITAEINCENAVRTSGLVKVTRLESDLVDEVNGYNWTATGATTFEADPPGISVCSSGGSTPSGRRSLLGVGP